ncbi:MAG: chromate transporter [Clostridia bacterium]|nr:chromate transporter [Clostridia bacterium]
MKARRITLSKAKTVVKLFLSMLKIGAFTFGGGYAMISLLQDEFVIRKKWLSEKEFLDLVVIAESTPGPIAINSSTYIGYKAAGVLGAIVGTLGMCIPSFTIIYVISLFFDKFLSLTFVANAFKGIQVCVIYLIFSAGLKMFKSIKKNLFSILILAVTVVCMIVLSIFAVKFSTIYYIIISGFAGLVFYLITKRKAEESK